MQLTNYSVNYSNVRKQKTSENGIVYVTETKGNAVFTFNDVETGTRHKLNLTNADYSKITLSVLNELIDYYLSEDSEDVKNDAIVTIAKYTPPQPQPSSNSETSDNYKYTVTISGNSKTITIPTYSYEFYEIT